MEQQTHAPALYSQNLKTNSKTFFFDLRAAKNGNKYITITESRIKDGQKLRSTLTVFSDQLESFSKLIKEMAEKAK